MSRDQQNQTFDQAKTESKQYDANAQTSYTDAQKGVADYQSELAKYAAGNPYKAGGEYETAGNKVISGTATGIADAARTQLQSQAHRTGANATAASGTAEAIADQAQRTMAAQQGQMETTRIGDEASYGKSVLAASEVPAELEGKLAGQQGQLGVGTLDAEGNAGKQPSFLDTFGETFAAGAGNLLTLNGGKGYGRG